MKQLYLDALAKTEEATWYPKYVDVTSRVAAVTDWNDKVHAPTEFLRELTYAGSNAAFMPDRVSPVVTPDDFKDAYEKLCKYGLIPRTRLVKGDDEWFSLNEWVMKKFRDGVPDGAAADVGHAADNHRRGIAVWGVQILDLEVWNAM